jgi:hypothetical protein
MGINANRETALTFPIVIGSSADQLERGDAFGRRYLGRSADKSLTIGSG